MACAYGRLSRFSGGFGDERLPASSESVINPLDVATQSPDDVLIALDRIECRESFAAFVKRSWHVLEPGTPLAWGWALDCMCEHLEAVTNGDIRRLLINCPPGVMKSLLVSVFWPAWEWGPRGLPHMRYVSTAHEQGLAIRDSRRMRLLVASEWYQARWPIDLMGDANAKTFFENEARGFRSSTAFTSMTGRRGDRVILDDPHSVKTGESIAQRGETIRTFREALPSRVNSKKSAIVIVMQRLHSDDVSGNILSRETEYVHLCLPMRFEPDRACSTPIGFTDPRTKDGELLFPELYDDERTKELEGELGSYGVACQLQQRPVPREGGMFKASWLKYMDASEIPGGVHWVRGWDLGATDGAGDPSAGVKMGRTKDGRYIIAHVKHIQKEGLAVRQAMKQCAEADGRGCEIDFPQDPGAAGKAYAQDLAAYLAGFIVRYSPETGSKERRAESLAAQYEAGNVHHVRGEWTQTFEDELLLFPGGKHDDQVDAASRAFSRLATKQQVKQPIAGPKVF